MRGRNGEGFSSLDDLLEHVLNDLRDKHESRVPEKEVQVATLKKFTSDLEVFEVGDMAERNGFGKKKYKFPKDGQLAVVSKVFSIPVLDDDGMCVTGELAIVAEENIVVTFPVDLSYYKKVRS